MRMGIVALASEMISRAILGVLCRVLVMEVKVDVSAGPRKCAVLRLFHTAAVSALAHDRFSVVLVR